ncbi:MAG: hypothetical protein UX85_C0003G0026 [Candidatus Beckwithbacteria bacterium GW2011_GWB1_47_15]|uniref:Uncharacterized protein n=1 Tax=Candidatus Beckwithbacteria bacterium GW2011_GWB1_47_15 TaxID=1618371 RepID=A0A0G1RW47_9BACT|nr:MAG: hypothetical protein UY43_C0001G0438 [Candidatus Beckwithbacteria bacterium GW2011_GWC1_49_16]KKU35272.1 MAG: hypothetical protein UX50_C0004G0003 [Candidatus Beckwithbacteria bacterium GW2011_GWA1_46_30]KKU61367.1 MAG: hypothetical protein UX85_C0003G0026 [Candidatus Beckwithbacteria bacterium GW2011_GWB1_47_15]KKU71774.1 MAG: hypothetical protein UX97_C0003G0003 [Candidatus Beckwithbacteria bacterium GW2011_GWA2_47_25]KKW03007.1 MAG: hypothetical protein UY37_C0008G0011 [Candidatus Be
MRLTKKQRLLWTILVAIASVGLLLTSLLPLFYGL